MIFVTFSGLDSGCVFIAIFNDFYRCFSDFRVPFGARLASKSRPWRGELADRFRLHSQGGSEPHFELILIDFGRYFEMFFKHSF